MPDHINVREEEQQKVKNLIVLKTPEQEKDAKVPEVDSKAKSMTTNTNTRKKEQQKATSMIALKTLESEGDAKAPEVNS